MLEWSVEGDAGEADYTLGVWFANEAPVNLSGDPDAAIPRARSMEHYGHFFRQTAPCHVAVAAFNGTSRGRPATMFLPWDTDAPASPAHQWAESREDQ